MNTMHLDGASDVLAGGRMCQSAASDMRGAAGGVSEASSTIAGAAETMRIAVMDLDTMLQQQRAFMDDWLTRLETVLRGDRQEREDQVRGIL